MSIVLPSFRYSKINLGKLKIKGVRYNELKKPIILMELVRIKTARLSDLFNDAIFAADKVVTYFPVSPDGSYAVRISDAVLSKIKIQDADPHTIPVLFIDEINHNRPKSFYNQLIIISATKKLDGLFASTFNFDKTKPRTWLLFYFNRDTMIQILKDVTKQQEVDLEEYNYAELEYHENIYNIRIDFFLTSDAQFYPKSFLKIISEEDQNTIYSHKPNDVYELIVTTSRLSIDEIHVGGTLYVKPRSGKIPYQYPFVIPFTYTTSDKDIYYPDDIYLDAFTLNVKVSVKIEKLDDFIKGFLEFIKKSDHLIQSLQKIAFSEVFIEGIKECEIAEYENIIRIERITHFLQKKSKFTFVRFGHLITAIQNSIKYSNEIMKILDNPDVDSLIEKLVQIAVNGEDKINYENLKGPECKEKMRLRLATAIIEVSLHGIAHLLKKGLIRKLSVSPSDLGEYIIIRTPHVVLKGTQIVDGFYRYETLSKSGEIQGEVKVFVKRSYSYDTYRFNTRDFEDVLEVIRSIIYVRDQQFRCDYNWEHEKLQLSRVFHVLKGSGSEVDGVRLRDCITVLDEYIKREVGNRGLYPPRSMFRYLFLKKPKIVGELGQCGMNLDGVGLQRLYRELKRPLQYIWPRYVHQCFDSCYACVILQKRDCDLIDIQQEFRVSKAGALYLLDL